MSECGCTEICRMGWGDQFQGATRELMVFTKAAKRYFDLDAVRTPHQPQSVERGRYDRKGVETGSRRDDGRVHDDMHQGGAPPLDWWDLPWDAVANRLTRAMVPEFVCQICGEPRRRIVNATRYVAGDIATTDFVKATVDDRQNRQHRKEAKTRPQANGQNTFTERITVGWTDCGHNDWRPGVALDPFHNQHQGEPMTATFYVGDVLDVLGKLPENSVDLVLSSPPFLALRSYLPADHPDKEKEGGSQSTPGEYIDWLLDVVEACDRVLAPHGSLCFELGDTYAGSGGAGGDYGADGLRDGQPKFRQAGARGGGAGHMEHRKQDEQFFTPQPGGRGWPLPKSLSLIPESFRLAMVYGFNPFTGRQTERWRLRNVIRWVRPNPPVGALGDKFRPATSELMVFCKSAKRYFDLDAVRMPYQPLSLKKSGGLGEQHTPSEGGPKRRALGRLAVNALTNPAGAPPLDWWETDSIPHREGMNPVIPHDAGAPPLDWWNIPLLEGEEPTKYGKKDKPSITPRDGDPKRKVEKETGAGGRGHLAERTYHIDGGAPPLDWWNIPPGGYEGAHYAVWPPELLIKPIKAMCPEQVCRECGEARRRIVGEAEYVKPDGRSHQFHGDGFVANRDEYQKLRRQAQQSGGDIPNQRVVTGFDNGNMVANRPTLGFTDCGHNDFRAGVVLDCFAGSGTTGAVASGHGRDSILIDLDERNYNLALERVGPLVLRRGEEVEL